PRGLTRAWVTLSVMGTLAVLAIPMFALISRSLGGGYYRRLFVSQPVVGTPIAAVGNSLRFAVIAMVLATIIGVMAAAVITGRKGRLSQWFDVVLMLALGTSAVTIGFGFLIALGWPVDLRASIWLVAIAHALVAVPFVVRMTVPTLRAIDPETREAAAMLGASPGRVWRHVDLPIMSRAG